MADIEPLKPSNTGWLIADVVADTFAFGWARTEVDPAPYSPACGRAPCPSPAAERRVHCCRGQRRMADGLRKKESA